MSLSHDPAAATTRPGTGTGSGTGTGTGTGSGSGTGPSGLPKRRIGKYRFAILTVLFVSTAINYLDRSVLSIVAPDVSRTSASHPR